MHVYHPVNILLGNLAAYGCSHMRRLQIVRKERGNSYLGVYPGKWLKLTRLYLPF